MRCRKPIMLQTVGLVPCGQCIACRLNYARQWSIRLMDEAKMYDKTCFLTLTYDEEHLPADKSIHKVEVQNFMKRLRQVIEPVKVRYFASGEYGEHYARPHYHLALFGLDVTSSLFKDKVYNANRRVWTARMDEWKNGFVAVGNLTVDSANYIAGYMLKKVKGKDAKQHYIDLGIEPEFALMSRRPGIGGAYLDVQGQHLKDVDFCVCKEKRHPLPRYYRNKLFTKEERDFIQSQKRAKEYDQWLADQINGVKQEYLTPEQEQERRKQFERNFNARRQFTEKPLND